MATATTAASTACKVGAVRLTNARQQKTDTTCQRNVRVQRAPNRCRQAHTRAARGTSRRCQNTVGQMAAAQKALHAALTSPASNAGCRCASMCGKHWRTRTAAAAALAAVGTPQRQRPRPMEALMQQANDCLAWWLCQPTKHMSCRQASSAPSVTACLPIPARTAAQHSSMASCCGAAPCRMHCSSATRRNMDL